MSITFEILKLWPNSTWIVMVERIQHCNQYPKSPKKEKEKKTCNLKYWERSHGKLKLFLKEKPKLFTSLVDFWK